MSHEKDLETLLDLDGVVIEQRGGHWTKFEVSKASGITSEVPHGIRYSLTLHDLYGKRIMGFDNAHSISLKKLKKGKKYYAQKTYDHQHRHSKDKGIPYEFVDAYQLLKDFWTEVDRVLNELGL